MDSVTQLVLGAAVGQAVMGKKVGFRAALWGGSVATVPDLDVFIPMGTAVADFTYHRSFSHSLFILTLLSPFLAWLINRFHGQYEGLGRRWFLLVWLALMTHILLDSFTIYGTQIFWPLPLEPVGLGSIFIIDPLYTLPLLIGVVLALSSSQARWGQRSNAVGLILSTLYLCWGVIAQHHVTGITEGNLARTDQQGRVLVSPAPFNSVLWRIVVMQEDRYLEGFYSLLDPDQNIHFKAYTTQPELLEKLEGHWPADRLKWFSKGFIKVTGNRETGVVISDLRMGVEPSYTFNFKVADIIKDKLIPTDSVPIEAAPRRWEDISGLMQRIVQREP